ncbi:enolase C-terminal domain-like protein [Paenibacillus chitinolyticus]|uniref:enolase C-terminal domain-like protein n=1 Tax=Paenibacillus chitinolyticus TaxID=79263 RepID=UPI00355800B5
MLTITESNLRADREPLLHPFGFKGGQLTELWQPIVTLTSESGHKGTGVGVQSPLWSDANLMASLGEQGANELMYKFAEETVKSLEGASFTHPMELFEQLYARPSQSWFARQGHPNVRPTYVLNALAAVDFAAWVLYAREREIYRFSDLLPAEYRSLGEQKTEAVAAVPAIAYGTDDEEITGLLEQGCTVLKIKLGSGGSDMIDWDSKRLRHIHELTQAYLQTRPAPAEVSYYLDLNGRYAAKDDLLRLLEDADRSGSLPSVILVEEPFLDGREISVEDVPARIAGDESIQSESDARYYMDLGYGALALKPAAKSMSLSLKVAALAAERGVPCFCADLTANPLLVEWTRVLAAHLRPLPEMAYGLIESNGGQNYRGWDRLVSYHPAAGAGWTHTRGGLFELDEAFYAESGGVFRPSSYYENR